MKYGVSRSTLLITAGVVWLVAGLNILRIGIICWLGDGQYWLFKVCEASLVFLLFFAFILKYYLFFRMFAVVINVNHIIKDFI